LRPLISLSIAAMALAPLHCDTAPTDSPALVGHAEAPAELDGCAEMKWYRQDWGLPSGFDSIIWRESGCRADPAVRTNCCVGPLQLYIRLFLRDARMAPKLAACGVKSEYDVDGPEAIELRRHFCVASALYKVSGFSPWSAG